MLCATCEVSYFLGMKEIICCSKNQGWIYVYGTNDLWSHVAQTTSARSRSERCWDNLNLVWSNEATLAIASNPMHHEKTKHVDFDCHFIKDKTNEGVIAPTYVSPSNKWHVCWWSSSPLNNTNFYSPSWEFSHLITLGLRGNAKLRHTSSLEVFLVVCNDLA